MIDYTLILDKKYKDCIWGLNNNNPNELIWNETNSISKPTKEKLDSKWEEVLIEIQQDKCKTQAQILLNESDWSDLYSVRNKLENINEWDSYRELIRELRINPIENPTFPDKPKTIWKTI
jgi:hypothetical protein